MQRERVHTPPLCGKKSVNRGEEGQDREVIMSTLVWGRKGKDLMLELKRSEYLPPFNVSCINVKNDENENENEKKHLTFACMTCHAYSLNHADGRI